MSDQQGFGGLIDRSRFSTGRILHIDNQFPRHDQHAGGLLTLRYLQILAGAGYDVTFLPAHGLSCRELPAVPRYRRDLQRLGVECLCAPHVGAPEKYLRDEGPRFDAVILSRARVASALIDAARRYAPQAKIIFSTLDLHHLRLERAAQLGEGVDDKKRAERMRNREFAVMRKADLTLVVSEVEGDLLRETMPDLPMAVLGIPTEVRRGSRGFRDRRDIVFVGSPDYAPNLDAIRHFVLNIWPRIAPRLPGTRFHMIGRSEGAKLEGLVSGTVVVRGHVEDLAGVFDETRLSVAPLRFGAGLKGKVLSSMSSGVPCVVTTIAAEGLGAADGVHLLLADEPEAFADAVIRVYTDEQLWNRLADSAAALIQSRHSTAVVRERFLGLLGRLLASSAVGPVANELP